MIKTYVPYEPDQQLLLPAALQEWLPDDHVAYFISDVVDQLDMSKVTARYERERRGGPPYHPQGSIRRCWLLLGKGSRRALCSGRGPVRRGGADPPRPGCATRAPRCAYPAICLPGTGCDGSYRPGGVGNATLCGCKLWSRYSARSSRAGDSGSSCCGDWRR